MVGAGEMNQADLAGVLQTIAQQQTAIFQQQAALLQVHNETVHLQRLLVEHMLSNQAGAGILRVMRNVTWGPSLTIT